MGQWVMGHGSDGSWLRAHDQGCQSNPIERTYRISYRLDYRFDNYRRILSIIDNRCCCLRLKGKQIFKLFQKRGYIVVKWERCL